MATILQYKAAQQAADTVFAVLRDARLNAEVSKSEADRLPIADVAAVHEANARAYLRLLKRLSNRQSFLVDALTAVGVDVPNLNPYVSAITTYRDARKTTAAEIKAAADTLLTAIPSVVDLYRDA